MIWAIINTLLDSISNIFRKKSIELSKFPALIFRMTWEFSSTIVAIALVIWGSVNFGIFLSPALIAIMILTVFLQIIIVPIDQAIYKKEKISTILPYENLSSIFAILISFFIFKDVSWTSFFIAILTVIVIILFSIDFKNVKFPKKIKPIMIVQAFTALYIIITWYILTENTAINLNEQEFFSLYSIVLIIILFSVAIKNKNLSSLKKGKEMGKVFWYNRAWSSILWDVTFFIYLFLMKDLWVITTILLGFLWAWIILLFSYLILWDKPRRKDVIMSITVMSLVWLWFYFR